MQSKSDHEANMQSRFIFCANAVAVADNTEPPTQAGKAWATATLPMTGGHVKVGPESYKGSDFSFGSATADVKGWYDGSRYVTENTVVVENLNIGNWLHADRIEVCLKFQYKELPRELTVNVTQKPYTGLQIQGQDFSDVTFSEAIPRIAGADDEAFRKELENGELLKGKYRIHKSKSASGRGLKVESSIAQDDRLVFDPLTGDFGYYSVKNSAGQETARVYLGEWAEDDDWQGVVGLRVEFRNPDTAKIERQIVVADWLNDNGEFFP